MSCFTMYLPNAVKFQYHGRPLLPSRSIPQFVLRKGLHANPENFLPLDIPATWGAMEKLYNSGKARAISAYSPLDKARSPGFEGPTILSDPIVMSIAEKLQKTPAQVKMLRAEFVVHPQGIYKSVEDFWDGEI
ncbi:hypothetical protein PR202_gb01435 [Eleusine coracana subsp. coracana]|uniref:Uncharacterized protein n=1 Tax=Eleusine coracana subsp. coracana TaxID=191504 RepID=A0AAV5DXF3_ELECO|nr:hypothetical protein PR202_gb01435 [Eleusine coracana subsp. coracana]